MTFLTSLKRLREENPTFATLLVYLIKLSHIGVILFTLIAVFISNNIFMLMALIIFETIVILQWYVYGVCILTPIENALSGKSEKSFMTTYLESAFSKTGSNLFWILLPLFVISVSLYKIYHIKLEPIIKKEIEKIEKRIEKEKEKL